MSYDILTEPKGQFKLMKGLAYGVYTTGIHFPSADSSGLLNVCPYASEECKAICLVSAGRGQMRSVQDGRYRKLEMFVNQREKFWELLRQDIHRFIRWSKRKAREANAEWCAAVRPNLTSDLPYHKLAPWLFTEFSDVWWYDYTKNPHTMEAFLNGELPPNYHITFSSEARYPHIWEPMLRRGGTVAMVFETLPETFRGWTVINGAESDIRFRDPPGCIVGLPPIGKAKKDTSGFVWRESMETVAV